MGVGGKWVARRNGRSGIMSVSGVEAV